MRSTRVFSSKTRKNPEATTTITFVLLKEDRDQVVDIAAKLGMSVSGICREALQGYVLKLQKEIDADAEISE